MPSVILSAAKDLVAAAMRSFTSLRTTGVVLCGLLAAVAPTHAETPDAALAELLKQARAKVPAACTQPNVDRLIKILCAKKIRVGIRDYYPLFATRAGDKREGYEVDVALAIGRMVTATPRPSTRLFSRSILLPSSRSTTFTPSEVTIGPPTRTLGCSPYGSLTTTCDRLRYAASGSILRPRPDRARTCRPGKCIQDEDERHNRGS